MENSDLEPRVKELERLLDEERAASKPLIDLYNASKIVGRIIIITGGILVGAATIWQAFGDYIKAFLK